MKCIWLGQAGLLFDFDGFKIMIDPYLSDSVAAVNPANKRRVAVANEFFNVKPDVLILTHDHLDHTDPETLVHYLKKDSKVLVLASGNAYVHARKQFGGENNYVLFNRLTRWTEGNIRFLAVRAEHSDDHAIGVILESEGKTLYITGDTLYNDAIFADLPEKIDYVFLPVNGRGNNMNMEDGARFCEKIGAKAVPLHWGLFDSLDGKDFPYDNKSVPQFYEEIML